MEDNTFRSSSSSSGGDDDSNDGEKDRVVLVVDKREFRVSIAVLTAASPVFEAMLTRSDMQEASKHVVEVRECDADAFFTLLRWVRGRPPSLSQVRTMCTRLLRLADRYQIRSIFDQCDDFMASTMRADNIIEYMDAADQCRAPLARKRARAFVVENLQEILLAADDDDENVNHIVSFLANIMATKAKEEKDAISCPITDFFGVRSSE